jgi:tryptophan-rich sensory protein
MKNIKIKNILLLSQPMAVGALSSFITRLISRESTANSASFNYIMSRSIIRVPSYIFPIVWTILYSLMGIAIYLVAKKESSIYRSKAFMVNQLQLFFNFMWMILYFGLEMHTLAFLDIILLIASNIWLTCLYKRIDIRAYYLMVPYLCWLFFASYLNFLGL